MKVTYECFIPPNIEIFFPTGCEYFKCHGLKFGSDAPPHKALEQSYDPPHWQSILYTSPFILCHNRSPIKKYEIAPKSGKNNRNVLRSTLITPRATSYLPLCTIKNQDDLLRQGKQLHTNCIMKVSKVNCVMIK